MTTVFCPQGGHCGEVRLYIFICLFYCSQRICSFIFSASRTTMSRTLQKICRYDVELSLKYSSRVFYSRFLKQITSLGIICSLPSSIVKLICQINVLFCLPFPALCCKQICTFHRRPIFQGCCFVCLFVFFFQISITSLSPNLSSTMTANLETVLPFLVTYIHTYFIRSKRAFQYKDNIDN